MRTGGKILNAKIIRDQLDVNKPIVYHGTRREPLTEPPILLKKEDLSICVTWDVPDLELMSVETKESRGNICLPAIFREPAITTLVSSSGTVYVGSCASVKVYKLTDLFKPKPNGWVPKSTLSKSILDAPKAINSFYGHHALATGNEMGGKFALFVSAKENLLFVMSPDRIHIWNCANRAFKQSCQQVIPTKTRKTATKHLIVPRFHQMAVHPEDETLFATLTTMSSGASIWKIVDGEKVKKVAHFLSGDDALDVTSVRYGGKWLGLRFARHKPWLILWAEQLLVILDYIKTKIVHEWSAESFQHDPTNQMVYLKDGSVITDVTEWLRDDRYLLVSVTHTTVPLTSLASYNDAQIRNLTNTNNMRLCNQRERFRQNSITLLRLNKMDAKTPLHIFRESFPEYNYPSPPSFIDCDDEIQRFLGIWIKVPIKRERDVGIWIKDPIKMIPVPKELSEYETIRTIFLDTLLKQSKIFTTDNPYYEPAILPIILSFLDPFPIIKLILQNF